jgi:predicted lipoprotein with Yx(FWY)xxD motif
MTRSRLPVLAALATITLLAAACAGDTSTVGSTVPAAGGAATIATADTDMGTVLVDQEGFTLYLFTNDTGSSSTCTADGGCAATWPAITTNGAPVAGDGVDASLLGTTTRDDGTTQVTYAGHPIYRYSGDEAAGDTNGQGVGGIWFAVDAQGQAVKSSGGGNSNGGGGGGYGY